MDKCEILEKMHIEFSSQSSQLTTQIGRQLGQLLHEQMKTQALWVDPHAGAFVIALNGELGAGKTTLTQGIAAGLGINGPVTSPTFTLVNEYQTADGILLLHMDSYRLGETDAHAELEAAAFGMEDLLETDDSVLIIEWAERIQSLLPADTLSITLRYVGENNYVAENSAASRTICLCANGPHSQQLIDHLATHL